MLWSNVPVKASPVWARSGSHVIILFIPFALLIPAKNKAWTILNATLHGGCASWFWPRARLLGAPAMTLIVQKHQGDASGRFCDMDHSDYSPSPPALLTSVFHSMLVEETSETSTPKLKCQKHRRSDIVYVERFVTLWCLVPQGCNCFECSSEVGDASCQ